MTVTSLAKALARLIALSTASVAVAEPSTGIRMCLNMENSLWVDAVQCAALRAGHIDTHQNGKRTSSNRQSLEPARAAGQHQGIAVRSLGQRLDGGGLVDHTGVVQQQQGPGLGQCEALAIGTLGVKDTGFATFDAAAFDQKNSHQVDTIAVRALGGGSADAIGGVDAELVCFDEPGLGLAPAGRLSAAVTPATARNSCAQTGWATVLGNMGSNQRSMPPCKALYSSGCQCDRCGTCSTRSPCTTKQEWRRRRYRPPSFRKLSGGSPSQSGRRPCNSGSAQAAHWLTVAAFSTA